MFKIVIIYTIKIKITIYNVTILCPNEWKVKLKENIWYTAFALHAILIEG